ncbi:hypothetical protein TD95_002470 [Thielaviopsis punctulata]|uniref:Proteasome assembly chaperone 3 n=1 Tax=Thielaviopsis punctulata TaxID=72032 RepID=A0A0F4Z959_9PEZI|nr:hypothetical protein TD95_002470 [Thielaviopsis punctulata]
MDLLQDPVDTPFPAKSRAVVASVHGIPTEACVRVFTDKIMLTLSQDGRLAQWIQVPIRATPAAMAGLTLAHPRADMLPGSHISPTTLLGGGGSQREMAGHLLASQIANYISLRSPEDERTLLLGLGLRELQASQEGLLDVMELVQQVI